MNTIKNLLSFKCSLLLCLLAFSSQALADAITVTDENGNKLKYTYTAGEGTPASLTGVSSFASSANGSCDIVIPDEVTGSDGFTHPVTTVAGSAFYYEYEVGSVKLGANVETIGTKAFYYCRYLKDVTWNEKLRVIGTSAFTNCVLEEAILPATVQKIYNDAFYTCSALKTVALGTQTDSIGEYAFSGCSELTTLTGAESLKYIDRYCFSNCKKLTGTLNMPVLIRLGEYGFQNCNKLKSFTFGDALTTVGPYAFYYNTELESVTFGTGLTELGNVNTSAFYNNTSLKSVTLPGSTFPFKTSSNIASTVFVYVPADMKETYQTSGYTSSLRIVTFGSTNILSITTTEGGTLQDQVEASGTGASDVIELTVTGPINGTDIDYIHRRLINMTALNLKNARIVSGGNSYHLWSVASNGTATQDGSSSWNTENDVIGNSMFRNMPILQRLALPKDAKSVGSYALAYLTALREIDFPRGVKSIGEYAFCQSTSGSRGVLQTIDLGDSLTTIEPYAFHYNYGLRNIVIPDSVKSIGNRAFYSCGNLQSVTLPDNLTSIGTSAFAYCRQLTTVNIPAHLTSIGNDAFYVCEKLSSQLTFPATLKTINNHAFGYCYELPNPVFSEGLTEVGQSAFYNCKAFTEINLPSTVTKINQEAFRECRTLRKVTLPDGLTTLGSYVFYECDSLRAIAFPPAITSVPSNICQGCDSLSSVTLAEGTTSIGNCAFYNCYGLKDFDFTQPTLQSIGSEAFYYTGLSSVTLPENITSVGTSCFRGCKSLTFLHMPDNIMGVPGYLADGCSNLLRVEFSANVTSIGSCAFRNCVLLDGVALGDQITNISDNAFRNCTNLHLESLPTALTTISNEAFRDCSSLENLVLPSGLKTLSTGAFRNSGLQSVVIPESITSFGTSVFEDCKRLTDVTLPANQKELNTYTFYACENLQNIVLPEGLTTIKDYVFYKCTKLENINFPSTLTTINYDAFAYTALRRVEIPDATTTVDAAFEYCDSLRYAALGRNMNYTSNSVFSYFYRCHNLDTLKIFAGTVPRISSSYVNDYYKNCVLIVPAGTSDLYLAADVWKDFKEITTFLTGDKLAPEDYALLKAIYQNYDGDNWKNKWDLTTDDRYIGKWYGVTTDGDYITDINLRQNGLTGNINSDAFKLKHLKTIDLSRNNIGGQLEDALADVEATDVSQELTQVEISRNQIKGDVSPFAAKLPATLKKLYVGYNQLTDISEPLASNISTFSYEGQFFDQKNMAFFLAPDEVPVDTVNVGIPATLTFNTLQQYYHSSRNYSNVPHISLYAENGWYGYSDYYSNYPHTSGNASLAYNSSTGLWSLPTGRTTTVYSDSTMFCLMSSWGDQEVKPIHFRFVEGDVNADRLVDLLDLTSMTYYFANNNVKSGTMFNYTAADGNSDKSLNILDVVINVNRILDYQAPANDGSLTRAYIFKESADDCFASIENGTMRLSSGSNNVGALQFELSGVGSNEVRLASDMVGFSLAKRTQPNGSLRVIIYSMDGDVLTAGLHDVLRNLPEQAKLNDIKVVDDELNRLNVRIVGTVTGLNGATTDSDNEKNTYDLSGRRADNKVHGIVIENGKKLLKK